MICPATPVHPETLPIAGAPANVPWVQATPHRAGIVGVLFAYDGAPTFDLWTNGLGPNGQATKILWVIRNVHAALNVVVRGHDLGGPATFRQSFPVAGGHGAMYPSIVVIPSAGCWRLDVSSGGARGSLIVNAVPP